MVTLAGPQNRHSDDLLDVALLDLYSTVENRDSLSQIISDGIWDTIEKKRAAK